jgi:hypothetical protein
LFDASISELPGGPKGEIPSLSVVAGVIITVYRMVDEEGCPQSGCGIITE